MTCKNCIHWVLCEYADLKEYKTEENLKTHCKDFINKESVVEVVRCWQCKYRVGDPYGNNICTAQTNPNYVGFDHYCGYGERIDI